jgi:translocation and assembly module TamB
MEARVEGSVPLALANGALADRAARVTGTARVKADIAGALVAPHISGDIRITDATFTDPSTGLALVAVAGSARFTQTTLWIDGITGSSAKGGVLSGRGKLSQAANGTMVAELGLDLDGLTFDDHELMSGKVGGNITLAGPIHSLNARGVINVKRLDVIVPNQLPRSIAKLELRHVNAPETRHTAREQAPESSVPINVGLDLKLEAADRIFVRGRGLDAQLGGALHVRGTTDRPIADGGFAMERGRFTIVGRQLDFTRGKVFFGGSVEPQLEMEATAAADGFTISVFITGPASKPTFRFLSVPGLPEDEVVARLLFNKSLTKLSPLQLAQLANEIDKIGGLSSGPGALDQIKGLLGIDVLDVTVEKQGAAAVSAGSYVNENTYIGVRQGTTASSSRVIIDHNLTKNLKARGELGADGNSKVGLGVEWDY